MHSQSPLRLGNGRMPQTILIKTMPSDGKYSLQKHLRKHFSKASSYDDLEEELYAELYRRQAERAVIRTEA